MKALVLICAIAWLGGSLAVAADEKEAKPKAADRNVTEKKWFAYSNRVEEQFLIVGFNPESRLYFRYGPNRDSGVELERVIAGHVVWRSHVQPLGVPHSFYIHDVRVEIKNGMAIVQSSGAQVILESHDLRTGKTINREVTG